MFYALLALGLFLVGVLFACLFGRLARGRDDS